MNWTLTLALVTSIVSLFGYIAFKNPESYEEFTKKLFKFIFVVFMLANFYVINRNITIDKSIALLGNESSVILNDLKFELPYEFLFLIPGVFWLIFQFIGYIGINLHKTNE